jgi:hypothetical protein
MHSRPKSRSFSPAALRLMSVPVAARIRGASAELLGRIEIDFKSAVA